MKLHSVLLAISISVVIAFLIAPETPTGGAIVADYTAPNLDRKTYAERLHDQALEFFGVHNIVFPRGVCLPAAHELYGNVAYIPTEVTAGYETTGPERTKTQSFVVRRHEVFGTIDFVKSPTFLAEDDADSLIALSSEAIVRVPKADRTTYLVMDLYGKTVGGNMLITRGRFSTPSTDCIFALTNGYALCDCDMHTIKGIAVGGVTSPPPVEERYLELVRHAEGVINRSGSVKEAAMHGDVVVTKIG